jgi:hypothetical protein
MTLPASGPISFSQVSVELGQSSTSTRSLNDSIVRTLFGVPSGTISMSQGYGKANQFNLTISSNQTNANLRTLAINAGWNQSTKLVATINSGVYVSSNATNTPALTVSGSFPNGVELINNGFIVGMGGAGGAGGQAFANNGASGLAGGLAVSVSSPISISNTGTIAGGGGGGGGGSLGGASDPYGSYYVSGGSGGGGRSSSFSSLGGAITNTSFGQSQNGGAGTLSSAGAGGNAAYSYAYSKGGNGGEWGATGSAGGNAPGWSFSPGGGGAGGGAVSGNANITWVATGTRLGSIT